MFARLPTGSITARYLVVDEVVARTSLAQGIRTEDDANTFAVASL
jgi:hypothetical protein